MSVYTPRKSDPSRGWIVHVPAFAEEMNKARPMVSRQARSLANQGYCVIVPDLYGTGDSSGEFGGASWQRWKNDVHCVIQWISDCGGQSLSLWGLRAGCMLALEVAKTSALPIDTLVLWQPISSGVQVINQFLRLRMAAGLQTGAGDSTSNMREQLTTGHSVEVAGYDLSPDLAAQLSDVDAKLLPPLGIPVLLVEVVVKAERGLSPVNRKLIEIWAESDIEVQFTVIQGAPFWTTQEIAFVPDLLEATTLYFSGLPTTRASMPFDAPASRDLGYTGTEQPLVMRCEGAETVGILHQGSAPASTAVLIVVGGPQYRVGSHRQFVYLARALANAGIPSLRFDYRGMGDSAGTLVGFQGINSDICCAVDALKKSLPSVERVVIWGLCDAATAASFYVENDKRIAGLILLNPWVRSEQGEAKAYLKHYYLKRVLEVEFWRKLSHGKFDLIGSLQSLGSNVQAALRLGGSRSRASQKPGGDETAIDADLGNLADRMFQSLSGFKEEILLILSGNDLTAAEFIDASNANKKFRKVAAGKRFSRRVLAESDHTFSKRKWRDQVSEWTIDWVKSL